MSASKPGIVTVKEYCSSEEKSVDIMKRNHQHMNNTTMPPLITPTGLDAARQWYLYQEIRPYCKDTSDTLQSCPKPMCPKPYIKIDSEKRKCAVKVTSPES
jgi:hypothetical protein